MTRDDNNAKNKKLSNIALIVGSIVLLAAIIVYAWDKAPADSTKEAGGAENQNQPIVEEAATPAGEAGKLTENEVEITAANFEQEVIKASGLVLVDAYAPWCSHCQKLAPTFSKIADDYAGKAKFGKMNSDNQDQAVKDNFDFAVKNGLQGYPTVWFYKDGKKIDEFSGEKSYDEIKALIDKNLN